MGKEKIILVFQKDGKTLRHTWIIRRGLRGSRDAKKVRKLQKKWGDPTEIIGSGSVATLLRKQYVIYNRDKENYEGVPTKEILKMGAEVSGVPVKKLQSLSKKIFDKVRRK